MSVGKKSVFLMQLNVSVSLNMIEKLKIGLLKLRLQVCQMPWDVCITQICFNVLNFAKCAIILIGQTWEPLIHSHDLHRTYFHAHGPHHINLCDAINMKASWLILRSLRILVKNKNKKKTTYWKWTESNSHIKALFFFESQKHLGCELSFYYEA